MYYRLNVGTIDGESRGYQWRELDSAAFVAIATGTRPLGDTEAQARDSTQTRADAFNRPMHYIGVWIDGTGWVSDMSTAAAEAVFTACGREKAGT
jgi:hypothetical protein